MEETPKNPDVSVHVDPEINFFGLTNYRSQFRRFGIKLDDRRRHMYMVGKTGMGKTTILENMVLNDIYAGHGVGLVDPHGDFAEKIIDFIPPHRVNDIVYFNPADVDYPIGFNILESINPEYRHLVASGLMGVFKKIWPDVWSARMEYILNNTILALLDYPDTTLMGINRLLADDDYREKVVKNLKDPVVRSFWVDEFAKYEERFRREAIAPIQNKIGQFLSASIIRNIVAQVKSRINIREIMDTKKIFIMNLSKGRIGEDNSRLMGGMLITKIQLSAMERVECANFDSSIIRNNSKIVDIKTSASKRFESNISPELAKEAMDYFSYLLSQEIKGVKFGEIVDVYPKKVEKTVIDFELEDINSSLGLNLKEDEVKSILEKFGFNFVSSKKTLKVEVPFERNDIKIKEDLVEEVGRIYGYENIPVQAVPSLRGRAMIGKDFYYIENIKNILNDLGFDEVSLYSLVSKGFFEIVYPLADDKKALREELSTGLIECISKNFQNLPILGLKAVKIFEIGRVFGKNGEKTHVCLGCKSVIGKNSRKNDEEFIQNALKIISEKLQVNFSFRVSSSEKGSVVEFDITESFVFSKSPDSYKDLNFENTSKNVFKHFSQYPFVLRDVALFVNNDDAQKEIEEMIKRICGDLLIRFDLFDVFKKKMEDGTEKNSYAYHLVFQSDKKTLTDIEVNEIMDRLYNELNAKSGWQVR